MAVQIRVIESSDERQVRRLLDRHTRDNSVIVRRVTRIVDDVRRRGDAAVADYARRFDRLTEPIEVSADELEAKLRAIVEPFRKVTGRPLD